MCVCVSLYVSVVFVGYAAENCQVRSLSAAKGYYIKICNWLVLDNHKLTHFVHLH